MSLRFRLCLITIALLFAAISLTAISWGLPSRKIDKYLFGDGPVWSGEKIYSLAGGAEKFGGTRGADVDVDPLHRGADPVLLTSTVEDVARIYLRYRLYTYQPDEMITMMALARMRPRSFDLDPRLYQYGGLFIYPVGALIGLGGALGLIDVRSDVVYYLDNPDDFGKFYLVSRGYAAAWGVVGVFVVFGIARRLGGNSAGLLAALLFTLMPVVICMAHEGKPHLPGAVLMLLAVYFAMRAVGPAFQPVIDSQARSERLESSNLVTKTPDRTTDFWLMCLCCGAAFGMVLSSLPIFVLIPLIAWMTRNQYRARHEADSEMHEATEARRHGEKVEKSKSRKAETEEPTKQYRARQEADSNCRTDLFPICLQQRTVTRTFFGLSLAASIYLITNPYIVINALTNREVLRSNFGNSLAMYEISRVGEGFLRVIELTAEGATWPVVLMGAIALVWLVIRSPRAAAPLAVVAVILFMQFVLIGAGKPGEYGRFGIFTNTALVIGAAVLCAPTFSRGGHPVRWLATVFLVLAAGWSGSGYLQNFIADCGEENSRLRIAEAASRWTTYRSWHDKRATFVAKAEPAPYCFPPVDFKNAAIILGRSPATKGEYDQFCPVELSVVDLPMPIVDDPHSGRRESYPRIDLDSGREAAKDSFHVTPRRVTEISWANKPFHQNWAATTWPPCNR